MTFSLLFVETIQVKNKFPKRIGVQNKLLPEVFPLSLLQSKNIPEEKIQHHINLKSEMHADISR